MTLSMETTISRRRFCTRVGLGAAGLAVAWEQTPPTAAGQSPAFQLRYIVASCMYGTMKLEEILPEVRRTGAEHVDLWPKVHGSQREELDELGLERYSQLLARHRVKTGILTRYDLGPFGLQDELKLARKLGARLVIANSKGPRDLTGDALKAEVRRFAEAMKPHVAAAEEQGVVIGIENHSGTTVNAPDAQRWLVEMVPSRHLGIALAPYHLDQDAAVLARLIEDLGDRLVHFYAWQHGHGCMTRLPKEEELLQMPGRGSLDFTPLVAALRKIHYQGWVQPFMHPTPRGIPILPTAREVTFEINRARSYLEACLNKA
jgi:sugar phosphate isomerase/epimerase